MLSEHIQERLRSYLAGQLSLKELGRWVDQYNWDRTGAIDEYERYFIGYLELTLHEIAEGLEAESTLQRDVQAILGFLSHRPALTTVEMTSSTLTSPLVTRIVVPAPAIS